MYKKVNPNINFVEREKAVVDFWKENKIFSLSMTEREGGKEFSFYDGPPTANGKPHIGHILTRVMKDIIPRYKTMKGYHVLRKAGWDTHGLPVELEVEKLLGFDGKQDIEKYGIEPFIKKCKESVWKYQAEWEKMSDRVGYWVDMDNPYVTYDDNYIESVWWAISEIYKKGLIYKGYKVVPYCPRCGTALSSHEVAQGYKDVEETSCVVRFKLEGEENTSILAWTTTPWTLPSNVALCVNASFDYSLIEAEGEKFILATELIGKHFTEFKEIKKFKGAELEGKRYVPLFDYYKKGKQDCFYVTTNDYVTLTDGTGVVHIAPAFGEDDSKVGKLYDLPFVQMVDERGRFVSGTGELEGKFCKDGDKIVLRMLKESGLLKQEILFKHSYPFCWRCDTPLLYYARSSWFIKMTEVREQLIKNNESVNWLPESIKKGRMGNFLENVVDWGFSRERYWGTPLPIWVCDECGKTKVIGSKAELIKEGGLKEGIELHKPYVDAVELTCECGHKMRRTPEVMDCWFDSGSMPFAQYHYPFENKEVFEETFPADFISEAVDQTRGWFYTLLAISTLLFDKSPFQNCIVLGHVNDKNGLKMSKHKGNVVDPWSVLDKQGADAVRWYFYTNSSPWLPSRFYDEAVSEAQRKFLGTLWNTYSFYALYAEIDSFDPTKYSLDDQKLTLMDKWALSGVNSLVKFVDKNLADYKITESARAISEFTDGLSNWYIRRCRERYWASGNGEDKIAAYMTLYTVLETLIKVAAPFVPFMTEDIYQNIVLSVNKNAPKSVHLTLFPEVNEKYINQKLEKDMNVVLQAAVLGRACRNSAAIKNRQPLQTMMLSHKGEILDELMTVIAEELNVKEVKFIDDASEYVSFEVKPQLKTLGPKYGKMLGKLKEFMTANAEKIINDIKADNESRFSLDGEEIILTAEDVLTKICGKNGFAVASDKGMTAVLNTTISAELKKEGYVRELISKIQTMRKEETEVTDRINVSLLCDEELKSIFTEFDLAIKEGVLAKKIEFVKTENAKDWDINGKNVSIGIVKAL